MTTELVANPSSTVGQAIPPSMGINPIFDWSPIIGVPFWLFITVFFLFVVAAVWVYWLARIKKLNAVSGWKESLNHAVDEVQVWLITRTHQLIIECMKIEDNILSYRDKTKIGMWHHNTRDSVIRVGGNTAVVVSEDYDQTRDIISEIALTDCSDMFNRDQERLKKENEKAGILNAVIEPISNFSDYDKYGRDSLELVHPNGLPMKPYNILNNQRFLKYFPHGCGHMFFGGELKLDANEIKTQRKDQGFWSKFGFPIIAAIIVIAAIISAWMVPLK